MNFFPGIYQSKRSKKPTSFSNPLTGAFYSNKNFLINYRNVPRSISDLDHIKQLKYEQSNEQNTQNQFNKKQRKQSTSKQDRNRISRQIIAVNATARMALNKDPIDVLNVTKRCKKALDSDTIQQLQKVRLSKTFTSGRVTTKRLFLTIKQNKHKNYHNYLKLLDQFYSQGKKLTFNQNIKLNFRHRLAQGNFDQAHFNYSQNYSYENLRRKIQLQNAQNILKKRTQTHRVAKHFIKQDSNYYTQNISPRTKHHISIHTNTNFTAQQSSIPTTIQNTSPQFFQHWKVQTTYIDPHKLSSSHQSKTTSPHRSKSPQRISSPTKSQYINNLSNFQKSKLKQFLNQNKVKTLDVSVQNSFKEEFKDLISKNDIFDVKFNHNYKNRVMKKVLENQFVYFNDKSLKQVDRIFKAIKAMKLKSDKDNSDINNLNQSLQTNQAQHDSFIPQSLDWEQFKNLRTVIGCLQPKQVIMSFIANYLNFNEFGQLHKQQLFNQVQTILGQKSQSSTVEVIAEIIWSWFQANSIVENGFIRRTTLQSWYEKYKIVYCMLVSLIFGTNHKTTLDLAYEVFV